MPINRLVSGYQTGADRAGIHAAYALKQDGYRIHTGGWVPADRRAEDGIISMAEIEGYGLQIHAGKGYPPRTEQNIKDSDGTLICGDVDTPGSSLTYKLCRFTHKKPFLCLAKEEMEGCSDICISALVSFVRDNRIDDLNVAGNRESTNPGIYAITFEIVTAALRELLS